MSAQSLPPLHNVYRGQPKEVIEDIKKAPLSDHINKIAKIIGYATPEEIHKILKELGYTDHGAYLTYKAAEVHLKMYELFPL